MRIPAITGCGPAPPGCAASVRAPLSPSLSALPRAGPRAVLHALPGGVPLVRAALQLAGAVGQLQQRHLLAQPVQRIGNLGLREPGERASGAHARVGVRLRRPRGARAQGQQDAPALQRLRADGAAPGPATSQPVHPRHLRAARSAPQAAGRAPQRPGERDPED